MSGMQFKSKTILIISPEPWDHIFVSKHHYAVNLAHLGNLVFFLNPPSQNRKEGHSGFQNLRILNHKRFPPGLRFYPKFLRLFIIRRRIKEIESTAGSKLDVVWSFDPSVFYDLDAFSSDVLKILHIVDLNQHYQIARAARTAHYCFCATSVLSEKLSHYAQRVLKISHGYPGKSFQIAMEVNLPGENGTKAIYAGNLAMSYIDWKELLAAVNYLPQVDFVFIGPGKHISNAAHDQEACKEKIKSCPNVYFIDRLPPKALNAHYVKADVLLICYQEKYHLDQANPHKLIEYLGSGKVVVATTTLEYTKEAEDKLIAMTIRNEHFPEVLKNVIVRIEEWNSEPLKEARIAFANSNAYLRQIERIEKYINEQPCVDHSAGVQR